MPALRRLAIAFLGIVLVGGPALACEPCVTRSSLQQTVSHADLIALVINHDKSSATFNSHAELLEVDLLNVYKGSVDTTSILVHSWSGQCANGVQMRLNSRAMLLLQQVRDISDGEADGTYKLVEDGCSEGQLPFNGASLRVNDKWLPLSTFVSQYINVW